MTPSAVPADFPTPAPSGAVAGTQPKVLARQEAGHFVAGADEAEIRARYEMCEDLANQLVQYTTRKGVERPDWSREQLQAKVARAVKAKAFGWGLSPAEVAWALQRAETLAGASSQGARS